ncbi:hypothetical protein BGX29_006837, partial [Mortierella sp. GBA35]
TFAITMVLFPVRSTIMKATGNPLYDQDKGIYMIPMLATNGTEELKSYIDLPKGSQRSISVVFELFERLRTG